jgi:hypothetical protein
MMPGFLGGGQNAQPKQPFGPQLKQALITAAPMFNAMAAGYSSGRGPYAYMDQGAMAMQEMMKRKREEEAAAAAAAAFGSLAPPGGNAGGTGWGGGSGAYTGSNKAPAPLRADPGVFGGGKGGLTFGREAADTGSVAKGGLSFGPGTGMSGFTRYEAQYGLPEGYLERTAQIESGGNPNAQNPNSSAGGLFQFIDSTAAQYGLQNKFDPAAATDAAARLAADNAAHLRGVLGREPTAAELYLAHQQGAGGAARLLANPNAKAAEIVGADAVRLNGGDLNMTAGEFASKWLGKFGGGGGGSAGGAVPSGPVDPMTDPYVQRLMQVMAMPGLTPEQRSVVELQLQTRMGQLTAENPDAEEERARARRARDAEMLGLRPGTPEFNQYVVTEQLPTVPEPIKVGDVLLDPKTMQPIYDGRAPKIAPTPMTPAERQRWGIPDTDTGVYFINEKGEPEKVGGGGVTVNNSIDGGGKFEEAFAKGDATTVETVYNAGLAAQRNLARIDQLESLLATSPTGLEGAVKQVAGEWGFSTEGLDAIQSAQAMINSLVPEQRQPGSGPMSDADLELFKQSLPRIINQPGGNKMIVDTMRAIAQYDAEGARIVQRLRNGELTRAQAFDALQNRANPLAQAQGIAAQGATAPITGTTSSGITWSLGE